MTGTVKPWVVKLGGELVEPGPRLDASVAAVAALAARVPLVVVHGGGREIDAETARRGIEKRAVDGLRQTDAATLEAVVAVLAGTVNTRFVARLVAAGARAVGLTGADAGAVLVRKAPAWRTADGRVVDLGLVGEPATDAARTPLVGDLVAGGYVPVMASLAADDTGALYNVNADTLAAHVAATLGAARLVLAGATPGVLDEAGRTIDVLDEDGIAALVAAGTASAGMVAKLDAARRALAARVAEVAIVDGRAGLDPGQAPATRLVRRQGTPAMEER